MTISEIIKNLLDQAEDRESSIDPDDPEDIFRQDARALREAARLLSKTEPPDVPLTVEQLREIGGEPVWVVPVDGKYFPKWMIVDTETEICRNPDRSTAMFETLGKAWNAYRRKPKEGTT